MSRNRILLGASLSSMAVMLLAGCAPQPGQPTGSVQAAPSKDPYRMSIQEVEQAPLDPDIVQVHTHYNSIFPWLQFDPTDPRPQGFMISALFLISSKTNKGTFGDGTITVKMYRVDRDAQRRETRTLVQTWDFNPQQALPYRATKRTIVGQGYQLRLRWREDLDLVNREIVVIVEFTRPDGKVIRSGAKSLLIPMKIGN